MPGFTASITPAQAQDARRANAHALPSRTRLAHIVRASAGLDAGAGLNAVTGVHGDRRAGASPARISTSVSVLSPLLDPRTPDGETRRRPVPPVVDRHDQCLAHESESETTVKHAVVWIDQKEARIFEVDADKIEEAIVHARGPHIHRHVNEEDLRVRNHPDDERRFFGEVARALQEQGQVLLVGPSMTKLHFLRYLQRHDHALEGRIVGIESADHPTDAQLVAHLRAYFHESAPRRDR